jgi:uncharacterized membrane protein
MKLLDMLAKIVLGVIAIIMALTISLPWISSKVFDWAHERQRERFENFEVSSGYEEKIVGKMLEHFLDAQVGLDAADKEYRKCTKKHTLERDPHHIPTFKEALAECGIKN